MRSPKYMVVFRAFDHMPTNLRESFGIPFNSYEEAEQYIEREKKRIKCQIGSLFACVDRCGDTGSMSMTDPWTLKHNGLWHSAEMFIIRIQPADYLKSQDIVEIPCDECKEMVDIETVVTCYRCEDRLCPRHVFDDGCCKECDELNRDIWPCVICSNKFDIKVNEKKTCVQCKSEDFLTRRYICPNCPHILCEVHQFC